MKKKKKLKKLKKYPKNERFFFYDRFKTSHQERVKGQQMSKLLLQPFHLGSLLFLSLYFRVFSLNIQPSFQVIIFQCTYITLPPDGI